MRNLVTDLGGYTGYEDEKGQAYTATRDEDSNPTFRAENLAAHQGLSIVVTWPKGLIAEPTAEQKRAWFIADNKSLIFGVAGWIVVLLYYVMIWGMVGRDPARGTIVPLYEPPDNMSPAAMRFLERMGFDEKAFTAAIMGLAAKGYLTIEQDESKTYKLVRRKNATDQNSDLSADEKSLARTLFEDESTLVLKNKNHELLARARKGVENNLHATIETTSFRTNARYLWPGIILTVLTVVAVVLMTGGSLLPVALFMSVWLTGWSFGVYALVSSVIRAWKSVRTEGVLGAGQAGFLTLFSLPFIAGECVGLGLMIWACGVAAAGIIAAAIGLNILFHHLLKAPTLAGRALMDRVEGFKMFLTAVDADRLQTVARPDKTPQLFERFLPYAFALGVEHAWAQQFSQVLAQAAIARLWRHKLFAFVVFRRGPGIVLRDGFYLELWQFLFQRYLVVFHCSRIVFRIGWGRFVRRRWWWRRRRRLVSGQAAGDRKPACITRTICQCFHESAASGRPLLAPQFSHVTAVTARSALLGRNSFLVAGSKITYEGKSALMAKSETVVRETFNFRDAKGRCLW